MKIIKLLKYILAYKATKNLPKLGSSFLKFTPLAFFLNKKYLAILMILYHQFKKKQKLNKNTHPIKLK